MNAPAPDPAPSYFQKLGEVSYEISGLEWLVIEVIRRLDPSVSISDLSAMTAGGIAEQLISKVATNRLGVLDSEQQRQLASMAAEFDALRWLRNDVIHARPATTPDGRQRLYRWAPAMNPPTTRWIDDDFLDELLPRIKALSYRVSACRTWLPPQASP